MGLVYTSIISEIENRRFMLEIQDKYDPTGVRDDQFIRRQVEPLFQPYEVNKARANLNIHHIVDMLYKGIGFSFINPNDLEVVVELLDKYFNYINSFDTASLKSNSDTQIIIQRARSAYIKLSELLVNHRKKMRKLDVNYKPNLSDILSDLGGK